MDAFDDVGLFFSDNFEDDGQQQQNNQINLQQVKNKYREFIRTFCEANFSYKYRDTLKRNYLLGRYYLEVEIEDLAGFDETLADKLYKQPEHVYAQFAFKFDRTGPSCGFISNCGCLRTT